ncbi:hypothetical protein [Halorussus halobius]|uniref:hypothetical protein n=1 Tax=Halorussus halobius TaxID=1710537 RepID=UPI001093365A|nr:hypothetical protein [Halorussus halobius]
MRRHQRFVYGQLSWMLATVLALAALGGLSMELFVVGSLLGLLVLTELTAPVNLAPRWRSRVRWLVAGGLLLFGYFMVRRVLEFLPEGAL